MKERKGPEELNTQKSKRAGFMGIVESAMRQFHMLAFVLLLSSILIFYILSVGLALTPGVFLFLKASQLLQHSSLYLKAPLLGITLAMGYFCYGLSIILVVPLFNAPLIPLVKPYRGAWFSLPAIPWYLHNALIYLVRYTFLDLMVPTPLGNLFYRLMGMKIGKGTMINTTNISDACLIELGDYVTIGGSASLMAHYGMKGFLIIDKLKIGRGSSVGLNASILGGVSIGKNVTIPPGAVVLPKTVIEDDGKFESKLAS